MEEKYQEIIKLLGEKKVKRNVRLADYTTFKIGGMADLFYEAETEEEIIKAVEAVRKAGVSYFILGGGSKLLWGDKGFRGLIVKIQNSKYEIQKSNSEVKVYAEAGLAVSFLLNELAKEGVGGLEFMAGIPGTIGGAIHGNAGAWQQNIGDKILRVKVFSPTRKIFWLSQEECDFSYRASRFKKNKEEIILAAELKLTKGERAEIQEKIKEILEKRKAQPKEPSVGSIFVNPKPQSAGEMIEKCGLKGKIIGGAKISEKHANFIINLGEARATDVVALIELARKKVKEKFGIELKEEVIRAGEF